MDEVKYIVMVNGGNCGLVKYRLAMTDGNSHEFDDLEQAIAFASANEVYEFGVVFRRRRPGDPTVRSQRVRTARPIRSAEQRLSNHAHQ